MYATFIGTTVVRNDEGQVVDIAGTQNLDHIISNLGLYDDEE